jgi:hypothetical protein
MSGVQQAGVAAASTLAADVANLVLVELKAEDGPSKYTLEARFRRARAETEYNYLQAFYHMGKLYFSVQISRLRALSVVFAAEDADHAWEMFSQSSGSKIASEIEVYLRCSDQDHGDILYAGHMRGLPAYIAMCKHEKVPNPCRRSFHLRMSS